MSNRITYGSAYPGCTWHLDEVFIKIRGELHYLLRAVDQHGDLGIHTDPVRAAEWEKRAAAHH